MKSEAHFIPLSLSIALLDNRWHGVITDEHMRRIFRPEAPRPAYWVNGPQVPVWHWSIG